MDNLDLFKLMEYLTVPTAIDLVLLISVATQLGPVYKRKRTDDKLFIGMLVTLFMCTFNDILALPLVILDTPVARLVMRASVTLSMVLNLFFVYLWTLYIDYRLCKSKSRLKRLRMVSLIPLFCVVLMLIVNIFTDYVFVITENGWYRARPLWFLYVAVQFGYIIATAWVLYNHKKSGGLHLFPIRSFVIPFVFGTIGEILIPGASLTTVGATIGYLMIYIGMLRENTYEDPLTGFYNSFFLEKLSEEAQMGTFDFASGILFYSNAIQGYLSENGIIAADNLLRNIAMILRDELPEGCETIHFGDGRFLVLSRAAKDQEVAVTMLIDMVKDAIAKETSGALQYEGCYAFRREGQDPGSLWSELSKSAEGIA